MDLSVAIFAVSSSSTRLHGDTWLDGKVPARPSNAATLKTAFSMVGTVRPGLPP